MSLQNTLELTLLGSRDGRQAFASGRLGNQVAFCSAPDAATIDLLFEMRDHLYSCIHGRESMTAVELDTLGKALGNVLIRESIGELYAAACNKGVRLALIINNCDLKSLPWEYLRGPTDPPVPNKYRSVIRIVSSGQESLDKPPAKPTELKVLLLVSASPTDVVPIQDLTKTMESTFRAWLEVANVKLTVREVPTAKALVDAVNESVEPWDVIHYLGHGDVRTIAGEELGGLELRGNATPTFYSAQKLSALLQDRPPRLVILSACSTASAEFRFTFSNTAEALVRSNIPAVLANQMVITPDSIAGFCSGFYRTLLSTGDIDAAVTSGRLVSQASLISETAESARVEWGIPVLYRHLGAQLLFV